MQGLKPGTYTVKAHYVGLATLEVKLKIEAGATVEHSIVMPGAIVHAGAHICRAVIGEGAEIGKGAAVGEAGGKIALVGPFAKAADNSVIPGGTVFGREELK